MCDDRFVVDRRTSEEDRRENKNLSEQGFGFEYPVISVRLIFILIN